MENGLQERKQHAFDCYCKKVLRNEARDIYKKLSRQREREILFCEMSEADLSKLCTTDDYFADGWSFNLLGGSIICNDERIAYALKQLSEQKRDIILLAYFLNLSDREIANYLNTGRANVQYHRSKALMQLKLFLAKSGDVNE